MGKKEGIIETQEDLAEKFGVDRRTVTDLLVANKFGEKYSLSPEISTRAIVGTSGLPEEERVKILEKHEKGLVEARSIREYVRTVKEVSKPVKEALLDADVNPVIRANTLI